MSPFLDRLNANLEKALAKKKKKKKEETLAESSSPSDVESKVSFVKSGSLIDPDLSAKVKDFLFQVIGDFLPLTHWLM